MNIQENISLKDYNTFGVDVKAKAFISVSSLLQLQKTLQLNAFSRRFIISGGSNMLLTKDIDALVIHIGLKGISVVEENENTVIIKVMAGENWHQLVLWALEHGYGGLENLALIPGNTGTAPIQNIGAYGVELKDIFVSCEAMHMASQELVVFSKDACEFGYRDSVFKKKLSNQYIITSVQLQLTKSDHKLLTFYGAIEEELKHNDIVHPTIHNIADAVIAIRTRKLPDPNKIGNSGSFFKNPVVSKKTFQRFRRKYPDAPFYEVSDSEFKIPAGWLIEQCGFKGKRFGDAGIHENQALVLVNYGKATGKEIWNLALTIQAEVKKRFGITITPEVNVIN